MIFFFILIPLPTNIAPRLTTGQTKKNNLKEIIKTKKKLLK